MIRRIAFLAVCGLFLASAVGVLSFLLADLHAAYPLEESPATTESVCTFGMVEGDHSQRCNVPIPPGCVVANFPGSTQPWTSVSKGGNTTCRFDEQDTDWKTRITGTCTPCKTRQCSGRFSVMFNCSQR